MTKPRRFIEAAEKPYECGKWGLWPYIVSHDPSEASALWEGYVAQVGELIREVEESHLSLEFDYLFVGFVIVHKGRRGTTISLWHWGAWGGTWEMFQVAWYAYRGQDKFELLALDEPKFSHYELPIIVSECRRMDNVVDSAEDVGSFYRSYLGRQRNNGS